MTLFFVNAGLVALFLILVTRQQSDEEVYDEQYFLDNPFALEEYQQMPTEFQSAFFRKHKDRLKELYLEGNSHYLAYCPNKDTRRAWLSEFLAKKSLIQ